MNVLANLQEKLYQSDLNEKDYAYWQEQFFAEYFRYRDKNDSSVFGRMTMQGRKRIHFLLTLIHIVKNRFLGLRHTIISDGRTPTKRPVIYAVTHIGKFDIEVLCEIIKEHCYILSGDYENVQGTIVEFFFALNGVFYFNEQIKADRAQVKQKMIGHLQEGGNILFFPEGAWNLSPNLPVLPCYWGIIDIAKMGNAVIRPVAIEQYGKHFDISFGNDFDVQRFDDSLNQKTQAITELRDALATLKWEIWERHPEKRECIKPDTWQKYLDCRFREWTYFSLDYVDTLVYRPKNITYPKDAFAHLDRLIPCKENAFLLKARTRDSN